MRNLTLFLAIVTCQVILFSCSNEPKKEIAGNTVQLQPNDSLFHINQGGYDFNIILPKDLMIENTPEITLNNSTGELNIHLGDQFWIVASLEKADIIRIKTELNEDMLFTNRIVEESDKSVMYQRILPDGTEYDYSFKCSNEIGGKSYFFRTSEEGEFKMDHVTKMKQAISSVHSAV
jgi:hypothetical protein